MCACPWVTEVVLCLSHGSVDGDAWGINCSVCELETEILPVFISEPLVEKTFTEPPRAVVGNAWTACPWADSASLICLSVSKLPRCLGYWSFTGGLESGRVNFSKLLELF